MNRHVLAVVVAAAGAVLAGCQADPGVWHGGLKYLNVHAVAFTPDSQGLVMVGPRASDDGRSLNATAFYYLHVPTMEGRRLGYGQYSLGQMLLCPFQRWAAVPSYQAGPDGGPAQPGYDLYDLATGRRIRRLTVEDRSLFLEHEPPAPAPASTQPATDPPQPARASSADPQSILIAAWQALAGQALTTSQVQAVAAFTPVWVTRGCRADGVRTAVVNRQTFYVVDSPDGKHRLFIRFNAPGGSASKAANPDGEGYAYGFLVDAATEKQYMLYTTSSADETLDDIGSKVFGGPAWLIKQPIRWIRGQ